MSDKLSPVEQHVQAEKMPAECPDPATSSDSLSPNGGPSDQLNVQKKKKKKKSKKSKNTKDVANGATQTNGKDNVADDDRPPVLCISRNKHWRYISSYHVRLLPCARLLR